MTSHEGSQIHSCLWKILIYSSDAEIFPEDLSHVFLA